MSCLNRYWLKEFIKFFSIIQVIILVLFIFIDYLSRMERFLKSDISMLGALKSWAAPGSFSWSEMQMKSRC